MIEFMISLEQAVKKSKYFLETIVGDSAGKFSLFVIIPAIFVPWI